MKVARIALQPWFWTLMMAIALVSGCGMNKSDDATTVSSASLRRSSSGSGGVRTGARGDPKEAFRALRDDLRTLVRCDQCHTSTGVRSGDPLADANLDVAYDAAIANSIGNSSNPASSKVLTYVTNGHCGVGAICSVMNAMTLTTIRQHLEDWLQVEVSAVGDTGAGGDVGDLGAFIPETVQIPGVSSNLNQVTRVAVPLRNLGPAYVNARIEVSMNCLTRKMVSGVWVCLYSVGNPRVVATLPNGVNSMTVSGIDFVINDQYDSSNRPFADPGISVVTANRGQTLDIPPTGAVLLWGKPGNNMLRLHIQGISTQ